MSATILPAGYVLDPAWHAERDRMGSLTSLDDARSLALCERRPRRSAISTRCSTSQRRLSPRQGDGDLVFAHPLTGGPLSKANVKRLGRIGRVKPAAMTLGAVAAVVTLMTGLSDGDLTARGWIALSCSAWRRSRRRVLAYYYGNRLLHKHGFSLFDDDDFDEWRV